MNSEIKKILDEYINKIDFQKHHMMLCCEIGDLLLESGIDRDFLNSKFDELCGYIKYVQEQEIIEIDISHIFRSKQNESIYNIEAIDEIISEFDNTRYRLERDNIKAYINKALGEALKITIEEDIKNLKSNLHKIDDICFNYINTSRVPFHKNESQKTTNIFE